MALNLIHASCVVIAGRAVLLAGPSGSGKSDVTLRLIDGGAQLVADDQTELRVVDGQLLAISPASIAGLLEIRHVGVLRVPHCPSAPVALYVEFVQEDIKLERLPEPEHIILLDHKVRQIRLYAHAASTPAKIRAALLYRPLSEVS